LRDLRYRLVGENVKYFLPVFYGWFLPHAGRHRNCNAAPLAIEKKCCALFFLPRCAGTIPKEAAYAVTGGNLE